MSKKKGIAALTLAGASIASVAMMQQRGILPKVHVDLDVTLTRNHGKHEAGATTENQEELQPVE